MKRPSYSPKTWSPSICTIRRPSLSTLPLHLPLSVADFYEKHTAETNELLLHVGKDIVILLPMPYATLSFLHLISVLIGLFPLVMQGYSSPVVTRYYRMGLGLFSSVFKLSLDYGNTAASMRVPWVVQCLPRNLRINDTRCDLYINNHSYPS
jgi:hypothetical protein